MAVGWMERAKQSAIDRSAAKAEAKAAAGATSAKRDRLNRQLPETLHASYAVPCQTGLHPFTLMLVGMLAIIGVLLTLNNPWLQVVMVSFAVFALVAIVTMSRYRLLAITDAEIVVFRTRAWRPSKPVEQINQLERTAPFNVANGAWSHIIVGDERLWVHKRYHGHLHDADALLGVAGGSSRQKGSGSTSGPGVNVKAASAVYRANRAKRKIKHGGRGRR